MKIQVLRNVAILGLFFALAVASIHAQSLEKAQADIPFDFVAGKAKLKSGAYTLRPTGNNAFAIGTQKGKTLAIFIAPLTVISHAGKGQERLVFNRYGDQYFLSQIWFNANEGYQLLPSDKELNLRRDLLAKEGTKPDRVEVAARLR